ncbi:MAG: cytochrome P460 family protein [Deltaproteobacteria bacterium]|nr:cytochrome P460 family protein [Deltaproteobacteria bacterium]
MGKLKLCLRMSLGFFIAVSSVFILGSLALGGGDKGETITGITVPQGYRDWAVIAPSYRTDKDEIRLILGNDIAVKAARNKTLPYPDGAILAKLAYKGIKSGEWEAALVPGATQRQEFMVKDTKKFASTGGWGFGRFVDEKPVGDEKLYATCFPCHAANVRDNDYVFTRFAP